MTFIPRKPGSDNGWEIIQGHDETDNRNHLVFMYGGIPTIVYNTTGTRVASDDNASEELLKEWADTEDYQEISNIVYDAAGVLESADVVWRDGSTGTITRTVRNDTFLAVDAYTVSHDDSGITISQSAVTRDANGQITDKPQLGTF